MPIYQNIIDLIGKTPLLHLGKISPKHGAAILAKLESLNPGGSIKDRPALFMIKQAEQEGKLKPGIKIVEATSGNTGISLSMIAAVRGYRCCIVMPEDMTESREHILKAYGTDIILTPAQDGMSGAIKQAKLLAQKENAFMPSQFENTSNVQAHVLTSAQEIWDDTNGNIDAIVIGVGTGGTIQGLATVLKHRLQNLQVIAVEPYTSQVLSGGNPGLHGIQGLGAGFIPQLLDRSLIDDVIPVTDQAASQMMERLSKEEGLLVGISSGANVYAARKIAHQMNPNQRVLTMLCDHGERYLA